MLQAGVDGVGPDQLQHGERALQGEVHRLAGQDTGHRWVVLDISLIGNKNLISSVAEP